MTSEEARRILDKFSQKDNVTKDDEFAFIEACNFLIETEGDAKVMTWLGGYYYEKEKYDLAEKYYLMAFDAGDEWVADGLGFIYYYGRTGERDYKKAFYYYSIAKKNGDTEAAMKIADMYHNGYYVEKDDAKYKEIIERLYRAFRGTNYVEDPLPELCTRLAGIREAEGDIPEAIRLLREGKSMLSSRIGYNPFFGNFSIMRGLIHDLYRLTPLDRNNFDLYDLYEVFTEPVTVSFSFKGKTYTIESSKEEDGSIAVCFNGKWYRSIGDMLMQAELDGYHITLSPWKMKNFTIVS